MACSLLSVTVALFIACCSSPLPPSTSAPAFTSLPTVVAPTPGGAQDATATEVAGVSAPDSPLPTGTVPPTVVLLSPTPEETPVTLPSTTPASDPTGTPDPARKLGPTLVMLMAMREEGDPPPPYDEVVSADTVSLYVEMSDILDDASVVAIEELGVTFHREGEAIIHVGTIYSADAPWEALEALAESAEVLSIESAWKPGVVPPC